MRDIETPITIGGNDFYVIKASRQGDGAVLRSEDVFGRIGPPATILAEQRHTAALYERGFPVPEVLDGGELDDGQRYFTESSLGEDTFHTLFAREYAQSGEISEATYQDYLFVIERYARAQMSNENRLKADAADFINGLVPDEGVLQNYRRFGGSGDDYSRALDRVASRIEHAPMGVLQFDLNPCNVLKGGVIDFELVGSGPIGYDLLTSARWGGTWYADYPLLFSRSYSLSHQQIERNDSLIERVAAEYDLCSPSIYLDEFLVLKSAWAVLVSGLNIPESVSDGDKTAFQQYRANILSSAVSSYLAGEPIDYTAFPKIK